MNKQQIKQILESPSHHLNIEHQYQDVEVGEWKFCEYERYLSARKNPTWERSRRVVVTPQSEYIENLHTQLALIEENEKLKNQNSLNSLVENSNFQSVYHVLVESFVDAFDKSGAVNYLTQSFVDEKTDREFEITIQKVHGESLAEKLDSLKNENEKLKSAMAESVGLIDSFIGDHQNKEVRLYIGSIDEYLDVRLDEHIDWSELVHAIKELSND